MDFEFARPYYKPKQRSSLCSILRAFVCFWVKLRHLNKSTSSKSNPVQSSRSELTTYLRKGRLLRFQLNSTATSDGGAQKLGNDPWQWLAWFWIDVSQSLQPDQSKNEWKEIVWKPYRGLHWLDELWFSALRFFQQSATEKNHFPFHTVTDQASITWSWSSIQNLNFKFSLFCG